MGKLFSTIGSNREHCFIIDIQHQIFFSHSPTYNCCCNSPSSPSRVCFFLVYSEQKKWLFLKSFMKLSKTKQTKNCLPPQQTKKFPSSLNMSMPIHIFQISINKSQIHRNQILKIIQGPKIPRMNCKIK